MKRIKVTPVGGSLCSRADGPTRKKLKLTQQIHTEFEHPRFKHSASGFTLIEVLISTAIMSVLLATASSSFAHFLSKSAVKSTSVELNRTLSLARAAAIDYGNNVVVCPTLDEKSLKCGDTKSYNRPWSKGWLAYVDLNTDSELGDNDIVLFRAASTSNIAVVFNQRGRLRFFPDGSARSAGFYVCAEQSSEFRHLKLLHSGRTRTTATLGQRQKNICLSNAHEK